MLLFFVFFFKVAMCFPKRLVESPFYAANECPLVQQHTYVISMKASLLMPCPLPPTIYVHSFLFCDSLQVISNLDPVQYEWLKE